MVQLVVAPDLSPAMLSDIKMLGTVKVISHQIKSEDHCDIIIVTNFMGNCFKI